VARPLEAVGDPSPVGGWVIPDGTTWAHGLELFDQGAYWESHEALEELWKLAPAASDERHLLQAIIQIAAGCLKLQAGKGAPALSLLAKATAHLAGVREGCLGIEVARLRREATAYLGGQSASPPTLRSGEAL
jgi:predicted metal-dependent hydrolase